MLSRNNVPSITQISSAEEQSLMKKLNKKKIKWIVREVERRELGVWTIAHTQDITPRHARRVAKKYKNKEPVLLKPGRKPKQNNRRTWVRYERKHSLSLGHTDWFEFKGKQGIIFIDDASRFITSHGEFDNANTKNSLKVFKKGSKWGIYKQMMSDHGTQFENQFTDELKEEGTKHIKSRVKHPQSNGKAERAIQTIKKLWNELGSFDKAVEQYNYKKPHISLTNGKLRTPYQAFLEKQRKE